MENVIIILVYVNVIMALLDLIVQLFHLQMTINLFGNYLKMMIMNLKLELLMLICKILFLLDINYLNNKIYIFHHKMKEKKVFLMKISNQTILFLNREKLNLNLNLKVFRIMIKILPIIN